MLYCCHVAGESSLLGHMRGPEICILTFIANIILRRGGIWNLAFKHHGKISKLCCKSFKVCNVVIWSNWPPLTLHISWSIMSSKSQVVLRRMLYFRKLLLFVLCNNKAVAKSKLDETKSSTWFQKNIWGNFQACTNPYRQTCHRPKPGGKF